MTEYKLRGLDPFVSWVVTPSPETSYLRNQNGYPTAFLDPDGNERADVQLRKQWDDALGRLRKFVEE